MDGADLLLDTNALSAVIGGEASVLELMRNYRSVLLPAIVVGEYKFGILGSRRIEENMAKLRTLLAETTVLPVDDPVADIYAQVRHRLKLAGRPIPDNDIWIAATAIRHGLPLLSNDAHFRVVEGLNLKTW